MSAHAAPGVLLATDLGPRCDRATARAIFLARKYGGPAIAATFIETGEVHVQNTPRHRIPSWYRKPSLQAHADRRLHQDLADATVAWDIQVGRGDAGEQLSGILDGNGDMLVVTGPARQGVLGPSMLGSTVDRLLRRAEISLLMVREPAHTDYRHLLVASDFSAPSRAALRRAHALFPEARMTLLHGFDIPMLGLMDTMRDDAIAQVWRQQRDDGQAFLRDCVGDCGEVELIVEHGDPARLTQQYIDTFAPDLVVVGTHGHGAVYELILGSVARRIASTSTIDTLLVRG